MKQMRGLYARANSLRKSAACSFEVKIIKIRLFQAFVLGCIVLICIGILHWIGIYIYVVSKMTFFLTMYPLYYTSQVDVRICCQKMCI